MNILLVTPPFLLSNDSPYSKTGAILPPLGLLSLAAYLRKEMPDVMIRVLDASAERISLESMRKRLESIDFRPDVVGITVYTTTFSIVLQTTRVIKEVFPDCKVVAGGAHASIMPRECLTSPHIDMAVVGEGEETFTDLVSTLTRDGDLADVAGIYYKLGDQIIETPQRVSNLEMENLPMPARDLVDISMYRPAHGTFRRLPATNMITSRGCPFLCNFCSKSIFGSRYRAQSPHKTLQEIKHLISEYGIREIIFNDDVFTCNQKATEILCDLLIEEKISITWSCSTRINLVSPGLLKKMKKSGCISVGYGIEAGDVDILRQVDKGISIDNAKEAIRWTKEAGIETRAFYIFGFPGETRKSMNETLTLALKLNTDFAMFNIAIPLPGTAMYDQAKAEGLLLYDGMDLYDRTDGPHPLIRLTDVSESELVIFYRDAYKRYYLRPLYILRQLMGIRSFNDIRRYAKGLFSFLNWSSGT
ncbi:MAG: B12-binding domain-containing radical SAM protein [Proteobacteria bacterium]|nr:B12-binding domain-containing radical SAM protein [Pseudomonadota bacterium]